MRTLDVYGSARRIYPRDVFQKPHEIRCLQFESIARCSVRNSLNNRERGRRYSVEWAAGFMCAGRMRSREGVGKLAIDAERLRATTPHDPMLVFRKYLKCWTNANRGALMVGLAWPLRFDARVRRRGVWNRDVQHCTISMHFRLVGITVLLMLVGCTKMQGSSLQGPAPAPTPAPSPSRAEATVVRPPASDLASNPERNAELASRSKEVTAWEDESSNTGSHLEGYISEADCVDADTVAVRTLREPSVKKEFSIDGYAARTLRLERIDGTERRRHCLTVAWPRGSVNSAGQPVSVAKAIGDPWFRAIANTLRRLPWGHVQLVRRIVIDNRPKEHGIAAFDRARSDDARDGRTIWLHQHLFQAPNHWAHGNWGSYWGYHVDRDGVTIDAASPEHDLFSPILLHEIGHLVMYRVANAGLEGPEASANLACARTCKDRRDCEKLPAAARELGCVSPYCAPFRFETSTENWAEQYRLYYQSSTSRALLGRAGVGCLSLLEAQQRDLPAPWERGLPDIASYHPSRWDSCGGRACKGW